MITVTDVQITHPTDDPYGEITAAYLRVKGPLLRVTFTLIPGKTRCENLVFSRSPEQKCSLSNSVVSWVQLDTWESRRLCYHPQELYFLHIAAGFTDREEMVLEHALRLLLCTTGVSKVNMRGWVLYNSVVKMRIRSGSGVGRQMQLQARRMNLDLMRRENVSLSASLLMVGIRYHHCVNVAFPRVPKVETGVERKRGKHRLSEGKGRQNQTQIHH